LNAERRQITVLFCDLAGFSTLAEKHDPEDVMLLLREYWNTCQDVIENTFQGKVAQQTLGDGFLALFGFPVAHEDDPRRAVRAALAMVDRVSQGVTPIQTRLGIALNVRVAIHTGPAVVGEIGTSFSPINAVGDTVVIAARLQDIAPPNSVVVSSETYHLLDDSFEAIHQGSRQLKGISRPVDVFLVQREKRARSRLDVAGIPNTIPLVGRNEELNILLGYWQQVKRGTGLGVWVHGGAGLGKSRLVKAFQAQLSGERYGWFEASCTSFRRHVPFGPFLDVLERDLFRLVTGDSVESKRAKVTRFLRRHSLDLSGDMQVLWNLLRISSTQKTMGGIPEIHQKPVIQGLITSLLLCAADDGPLVLVIDDFHWADSSSVDLIEQWYSDPRFDGSRVLLMVTSRSAPEGALEGYSRLHPVHLNPLTDDEAQDLVFHLLGGEAPANMQRELLARTGGNPLYIEESVKWLAQKGIMTKAVGESKFVEADSFSSIPPSLQSSLTARLDALPTESRTLVSLMSAVGAECTLQLVKDVARAQSVVVMSELDDLVSDQILVRKETDEGTTYPFKHGLLQEAAYQSLLRPQKLSYHRGIAEILDGKRYRDFADRGPELLAHHFTEAVESKSVDGTARLDRIQRHLVERAVHHWIKAGQRSVSQSANIEAIEQLRKGFELIALLPKDAWRLEHELVALLTMGIAIEATEGYASPELERICAQAEVLCRLVGADLLMLPVLMGLGSYWIVRANFDAASELTQLMLRIARGNVVLPSQSLLVSQAREVARSPVLLVKSLPLTWRLALVTSRALLRRLHLQTDMTALLCGYGGLGVEQFWRGNFEEAIANLEYSWNLYRSKRHQALGPHIGQDAGVTSLCHLGLAHWITGQRDKAMSVSSEALRLSQEINHIPSRAYALHFAAVLSQFRGDRDEAFRLAQEEVVIAKNYGLRLFSALGRTIQAWAEPSGLSSARIGAAIADYHALGAKLADSYLYSLLADAHRQEGNHTEALRIIDQSLDSIEHTGERFWKSELIRAKGELLALQSDAPMNGARSCLETAQEIAQSQGAKTLQWRATMSLARLLLDQGQEQQAKELVNAAHQLNPDEKDDVALYSGRPALQTHPTMTD
jgi:class 3 adenylate cyclase/tetratricopeptide (TPR) repeat protein